MKGQNLFESRQRSIHPVNSGSPCVFISHNSKDKPMANAVANILTDMGVDIYFDAKDRILQNASASDNDAVIVKCIEDGLDKSTHLLGLITTNTFRSWWVPYEIGGANGRNKGCAHLIDSNVNDLPSYIKVKPVLIDISSLIKWVAKLSGTRRALLEKRMSYGSKYFLESYVRNVRAESRIRYYK